MRVGEKVLLEGSSVADGLKALTLRRGKFLSRYFHRGLNKRNPLNRWQERAAGSVHGFESRWDHHGDLIDV